MKTIDMTPNMAELENIKAFLYRAILEEVKASRKDAVASQLEGFEECIRCLSINGWIAEHKTKV